MSQSWFRFKNSADPKSVEIEIYDAIGSYNVSAKSFIAELKRAGQKDVTLRIHSPGGNILEGNAIYNALKRHSGSIDVVIDGIAASMASVIAMAGDTIEIAENGLIMIHNPSAFAGGDSRDMRKTADVMDKMKANIITAYAQQTGLSREKISQMMDDETWMTAAEALEHGFVDLIGGKSDAKNSFDLSQFKNCATAQAKLAAQVACGACGKGFCPENEPEIAMGAVACPHCGAHVDQEGGVVDTLPAQHTSSIMDLTQALAKITELEAAAKNWEAVKSGLEQAKADAEAKATKAEGELKTANEKITKIEGELKEAADKVTKVEGELKTATDTLTKKEGELKTANENIATLQDESKTAEQKAREIAARNGANLPAKQPSAGDKTTEGDKSGLTGMAKARAYFESRQAKPNE